MTRKEFFEHVCQENLIRYFRGKDGYQELTIQELENILFKNRGKLRLQTEFIGLYEQDDESFILTEFGRLDIVKFMNPGHLYYPNNSFIDCEKNGFEMIYSILHFNNMQAKLNEKNLKRTQSRPGHLTIEMIKAIPLNDYTLIYYGDFNELRQTFLLKSYGGFELKIRRMLTHSLEFEKHWEMIYGGYDPIYEPIYNRCINSNYIELFLKAEQIFKKHLEYHKKDIDDYNAWMTRIK